MWMFNTTSLQFTWLGGDNTQPNPVFGGIGEASADYWPGQLQGACMVVDSMNNLWLIGGINTGVVSTVWHFNISSRKWSLQVDNNNAALSGPDYVNKRWNGRYLSGCTIDEEDRVWLFGGYHLDWISLTWNDMWSFDTKTVTWRVERETNDTVRGGNVASVDTFDVNNYPRGRDSVGMVDRRDGTLMLYGGRNPDDHVSLSDIWVFNKTSKLWKVVFGQPNDNAFVQHTYGTYRGAGSKLGSRAEHSVESGPNAKGNMIIFGGGNLKVTQYLNDIWVIPQDFCSTNLHDCDPNALCAMTSWTYTCTCNDGYTGDGKTCTIAPPGTQTVPPDTQHSTPTSSPTKKATTSGSSYEAAPSLFVALSLTLLSFH